MVKTKPIHVVKKKWIERASIAADDYKTGIETAEDWASATEKAAKRWQDGVTAAIRENRFVGGVRAAGTEKWKKKALEVGASRYPDGIRAAETEYEKAMAEVLRVIEGVTLPERGPRGDPKNYDRVKAIGDALHKWAIAKKKA